MTEQLREYFRRLATEQPEYQKGATRLDAVVKKMMKDGSLPTSFIGTTAQDLLIPPTSENPNPVVVCGDFKLNASEGVLRVANVEVNLRRVDAQILEVLMRNENHVLSRRQISEAVTIADFEHSRTIDVHIATLRKQIGQVYQGEYEIKTVRSYGYKFGANYGSDWD